MNGLRKYRRETGTRQSDFADEVGVSQGTISKIENGDSLPSLTLAISISRVTEGAVPVEAWSTPPPPVATPPEQTSEDAA